MFSKKTVVSLIFKIVKMRFGAFRPITGKTLFTDLKFDKYDIIYVALACEEVFNIHISETELATFVSAQDVISLVMKKLSDLGLLITKQKPITPYDDTCENDIPETVDEETEKLPDPPQEITIDEVVSDERSISQIIEDAIPTI